MKFIHYLTIIFFCGTLMFPGIAYDPVIEYHRLHKRYVSLTPPVFLVIHKESCKYDELIVVPLEDIVDNFHYERTYMKIVNHLYTLDSEKCFWILERRKVFGF